MTLKGTKLIVVDLIKYYFEIFSQSREILNRQVQVHCKEYKFHRVIISLDLLSGNINCHYRNLTGRLSGLNRMAYCKAENSKGNSS